MARAIGLRAVQIALALLVLSFLAYIAIGLMPGDPIDLAMAADPRLTPADAERMRALHGLDRPLLTRWWAWLLGAVQGEFGPSRLFARPVVEVLVPALVSTLELVGLALLLAAGSGIALGALAALRPRWAPAVEALAVLGQAVPAFWAGILLIIVFAIQLGWLPAGGMADFGDAPWRFLVLPVATLAIGGLAAYARHTAAAMGAVLLAPFIVTARARGAGEARIAWVHAFSNAAVPLLQLAALDIGGLVGGALVTETVFARPGMGKLLYDAVMGNDHPLALAAVLLVALATMLATAAADVAQRALDPRL
ncbi:peptide/nickel transport system permease protein [Humitalea rosea]|uniref:Peptide/nickel transport system permease protein n=1 Tax=Humitalea rosea TaxID=990373 RepID=A0A2W7IN96_9PROT|nr:ABC transporter permease [Humitalea rosea]PZW48781.1 peptide/nickel transport system permease protein [Humitalea rosea]